MKKFFLLAATVVASLTINAAEWNFGEFADFSGLTEGSTVIEDLGFFALPDGAETPFADADNKRFGFITSKQKTFEDSFKGTKVCKTNGGGNFEAGAEGTPKQRYLYANVTGNSSIKVWFESGSSNPVTLYISDGTNVLASREVSSGDKDLALILEANYVGDAGRICFYGSGSIEFFKIEINAAQGINDVNADVKAEKFFRDGQLIIRKNGVEYNALGAQL